MLTVLGGLAEFERELILARGLAGGLATKIRGLIPLLTCALALRFAPAFGPLATLSRAFARSLASVRVRSRPISDVSDIRV
jgi:hypothetical protein